MPTGQQATNKQNIMHNNIIKTNIANNTIAIIACFTGEYCLKTFNYYDECDGPNYPNDPAWANIKTDQDKETLESLIQDQGWDCIIAIPIDQLKSYFDQIMQLVNRTFDFAFSHNGHLGDDTFYDYLPDAAFMLGQIASHIAIKTKDPQATFDSLLKPLQDLVAKYDATYPSDETLANQMDYSSLKEGHQLCLTAFDATKQ